MDNINNFDQLLIIAELTFFVCFPTYSPFLRQYGDKLLNLGQKKGRNKVIVVKYLEN